MKTIFAGRGLKSCLMTGGDTFLLCMHSVTLKTRNCSVPYNTGQDREEDGLIDRFSLFLIRDKQGPFSILDITLGCYKKKIQGAVFENEFHLPTHRQVLLKKEEEEEKGVLRRNRIAPFLTIRL